MKGTNQAKATALLSIATLLAGVFFLFSTLPDKVHAATTTKAVPSKKTAIKKKKAAPKPTKQQLFDAQYGAQLHTLIAPVQIGPKDSTTFTVTFKNTGKTTWLQGGANAVTLYTDPSKRTSVFAGKDWINNQQAARLQEKSVPPGAIGTFVIPFHAPSQQGTYQEKFKAAVEDKGWIKGTYVTIPVEVNATIVSAPTAVPLAKSVSKSQLAGMILLRSHTEIAAVGGSTVELHFGIKNTGPTPWHQVALSEPGVALASDASVSAFHDATWVDNRVAVALGDEEYPPGRLALVNFTARMPSQVGSYTLKLQLTSDGAPIDGAIIEVPVTITSPAPDANQNPTAPPPPVQTWVGVPEPKMRVGVQNTEDAHITVNVPYLILNDQLVQVGTLAPGTDAELIVDSATHTETLRSGDLLLTAPFFRLEPTDWTQGIFTITNFSNPLKWNKAENDNVYRGAAELRVSVYGNAWLVDEVPLEEYVKGIDEVPDSWAPEMHKAQAIAARSYALYYMEHGGKHDGTAYVLNAGSYDQVYHGYNAEMRNDRFVAQVTTTRGTVIRYNGATANTVYFARSNGQTKSWSQVWGGTGYPYLQPRTAEFDAAKQSTEFGHGVGMSQTDGAMRADAGATVDQILNAYYTDITIDRVYE